MAKVKIKRNSKGILAALDSDGIRDALADAAETIEQNAIMSAPFETGAYQDSIHSMVVDGDDRPVAYIIADAEHSLAVEAKTNNLANAAFGGAE